MLTIDNIVIGITLLPKYLSPFAGEVPSSFGDIHVTEMTPPPVIVNSYVKSHGKPFIDNVSKVFILSELPLGIIRLPILSSKHLIYTLIAFLYSLAFVCYLGNIMYYILSGYLMHVVIVFMLQGTFFIFFNLLSIKRLQRYYNELDEFDKEVGCRPKIAMGTIQNIVHGAATLIYFAVIFTVSFCIDQRGRLIVELVPFVLCHVMEVHYYAHLLSLLIPRLRLINYYMEISLTNTKVKQPPKVDEFVILRNKENKNKHLCKMEKLMNLYHIMIKAYNYLIESIKWQLLVTIIASFVSILLCSYQVSFIIIRGDTTAQDIVSCFGLSAGIMLPLFGPCMLGDRVHAEVRRLRELLASRLYENQLDKSSRGVARALLAWTETRDLSFCLLRMLDIDISLPFKFVGLLVTYLIILLQFQKVTNP